MNKNMNRSNARGRGGRFMRSNHSEKNDDNADWKRGENIMNRNHSQRNRNFGELIVGNVYNGIVKSRQNHGVIVYIRRCK